MNRSPEAPQIGSRRDVKLDALRGLFLIGMTIDHLPSLLVQWVYEALGYVTAAEGFVFLSGFVAGLTYARAGIERGDGVMWDRARKRARLIYIYHVITFILILAALRLYIRNDSYWITWKPLILGDLWLALLSGGLLIYQPLFLDILPMYCLFILATPLIIQLAKDQKLSYALGYSCLLWVVAQFGMRDFLTGWSFFGIPVRLGDFDVFAWQLLFVLGVALGFMRHTRGEHCFDRLKPLVPMALLVAAGLFMSKHGFIRIPVSDGVMSFLIRKITLGPFRIIDFFALSLVVVFALRYVKSGFVIKSIGYLGKHSLQVFSFHVLLVCAVDLLRKQVLVMDKLDELLVVMVCVSGLFLPAWFFEVRKRLKTSNGQGPGNNKSVPVSLSRSAE
jgi:hypothetical protein